MRKDQIDARTKELKQNCLAQRAEILERREAVLNKQFVLQDALKQHYSSEVDVYLEDEELLAAKTGFELSGELLHHIDQQLHTLSTSIRDLEDIEHNRIAPMAIKAVHGMRWKLLLTIVTFVVTLVILL